MKVRKAFVSNSSSSSFICKVEMEPEEASKLLHDLLDFYNEWFGKSLTFEEVFDEPFYAPQGYKEWYVNHYNHLLDGPPTGKLVIESASDNTIPWELWEMICERFDALRMHLG